MKLFKKGVYTLMIASSLIACKDDKKETVTEKEIEAIKELEVVENEDKVQEPSNLYLIAEKGFYGITKGMTYADKPENFRVVNLETDEGLFSAYEILSNDREVLGISYPKVNDETKIGFVTILSDRAITKDSIKVGSTFGDLLKRYPNLEVNGSEIESRSYANIKNSNISYRLAISLNTYEVDENDIEPATKIMEIMIDYR